MNDLAELSLAAAADGIRRRRFSSWELTQACLKRIGAWQPHTKAFIALDHGGALKAAAQADAATARGVGGGALHGVPLAHKDIFFRANTIVSAGSKILDKPGTETATVLARLDAAGAIDIGALNLHEFASGPTGHNAHFGDCRNPWNGARVTGGSSSGSAAAVASRMVFASLGTDTGGSIRVPAHFCGITGLRPTLGRVSKYGVFPRAWSFDTIGPMARTAEDAALLLQAVAGADPADADAESVPVPDYAAGLARPIRDVRIGVPKGAYFTDIDGGIASLLDAARTALAKLGAVLVEVETPDPAPLNALMTVVSLAEGASIHAEWFAARPGDYGPGTREPMETGLYLPALRYLEAQRQRGRVLKQWLETVFDKADVLLTPVFDRPTPELEATQPGRPDAPTVGAYGRFTTLFAYLGLPALTVPIGFQADGMPAGMQLIGRPFAEAELLNVAHVYQLENRWHEKAPALPV